jgi:hypothetical protein
MSVGNGRRRNGLVGGDRPRSRPAVTRATAERKVDEGATRSDRTPGGRTDRGGEPAGSSVPARGSGGRETRSVRASRPVQGQPRTGRSGGVTVRVRDPRGSATARSRGGAGGNAGPRHERDRTSHRRLSDLGRGGTNGQEGAAAAMRYGCRRGEAFEGCARTGGPAPGSEDLPREGHDPAVAKPGEPQVRYRLQHAGNRAPEEAVEVVRNHEDGTRTGARRSRSDGRSPAREDDPEWTGAVKSEEGHTRRTNPTRGGSASSPLGPGRVEGA